MWLLWRHIIAKLCDCCEDKPLITIIVMTYYCTTVWLLSWRRILKLLWDERYCCDEKMFPIWAIVVVKLIILHSCVIVVKTNICLTWSIVVTTYCCTLVWLLHRCVWLLLLRHVRHVLQLRLVSEASGAPGWGLADPWEDALSGAHAAAGAQEYLSLLAR